jgi:non-specific serine/threonine protein kinase
MVDAIVADLPDPALRDVYLRGASVLLPAPRAPSERRVARERFGGLTARERQVAARIARGLTNRQIADELVVGERTVEGYVSSILDRLGFSSRAQVAAWAVEHGLAASDA